MVKRVLYPAMAIALLTVPATAGAHVLSMARARSKALDVGAQIATEYNANQEQNHRYIQLASDRSHCARADGSGKKGQGKDPISYARVHRHKVICSLYYFRHHNVDTGNELNPGNSDEVDYCTLAVTITIKGKSKRLHASHPAQFTCSATPQG